MLVLFVSGRTGLPPLLLSWNVQSWPRMNEGESYGSVLRVTVCSIKTLGRRHSAEGSWVQINDRRLKSLIPSKTFRKSLLVDCLCLGRCPIGTPSFSISCVHGREGLCRVFSSWIEGRFYFPQPTYQDPLAGYLDGRLHCVVKSSGLHISIHILWRILSSSDSETFSTSIVP